MDFITNALEKIYKKIISAANLRNMALQTYIKKFDSICTKSVAAKMNDFEYTVNSA